MPRAARTDDLHETAAALPGVTLDPADDLGSRPVAYRVAGKPFLLFREPRPDAVDPVTGQRYDDVVVVWVADEGDKAALVEDPASPWFTTPHFAGHRSVLVREAHLGRLAVDEVVEVVQDAWLSRAPKRLARDWLLSRAAAEAGPAGSAGPAG